MKKIFLFLFIFSLGQVPTLWMLYNQNKINKKNTRNILACETIMKEAFYRYDECDESLVECMNLVEIYQKHVDDLVRGKANE